MGLETMAKQGRVSGIGESQGEAGSQGGAGGAGDRGDVDRARDDNKTTSIQADHHGGEDQYNRLEDHQWSRERETNSMAITEQA